MTSAAGTVDLLSPPGPEEVNRAVRSFGEAMHQRYGHRLKGLFLFGSRARGDCEPFSDVDLAVILDGTERLHAEMPVLSGIAYDIFLATGAEIQPWVFAAADWNDSVDTSSSSLIRSAKRDCRAVQA